MTKYSPESLDLQEVLATVHLCGTTTAAAGMLKMGRSSLKTFLTRAGFPAGPKHAALSAFQQQQAQQAAAQAAAQALQAAMCITFSTHRFE
jgi:hypothetical protein